MKTTLDLPDDLVQRMKIRAIHDKKPLKRLVADLLLKGLDMREQQSSTRSEPLPAEIMLNERGFPVIRCGPNAPASRMTMEDLLTLEQQALLEEDLERVGLSH